jgi:hypothetical protein
MLVQSIVRYGTWQMPVRYQKTPSGGSCYPGCHPTYGYDRDRAMKNVIGSPTTQNIAPIPRQRPASIVLDAIDVNGTSVRIPGGTGPTVIEVVRTDQPQTRSALDVLATSLKDRADARVIVLLVGSGAEQQSKPLAASRTNWFCVADPDGAMSSELEVHASPMTLVVRRDGTEVARISGAPESLALKLPLYLDLASGKLDASTAQQKLTTRPTSLAEPNRPPLATCGWSSSSSTPASRRKHSRCSQNFRTERSPTGGTTSWGRGRCLRWIASPSPRTPRSRRSNRTRS